MIFAPPLPKVPRYARDDTLSRWHESLFRLRVSLVLFVVAAMVVGLIGTLDLRMRNHALAAEPAEVRQILPASGLILFEERGHPGEKGLDDVRADSMVKHRCRAHLRGSAAEQEVTEGMIERRDSADSGEFLVRKRFRQLCHLGERQRENRRATEPTR